MSDAEQRVECLEHGPQVATWTCRHLATGLACGYHGSWSAPEDDPWPDAWCDACFVILEEEQGWNERSEAFAGVTRLCSGCYEAARERNAKVPFESPRERPQLPPELYEALLEKAAGYIEACQGDREPEASDEAQRIGCLVDGRWRWAWDDAGLPAPTRQLSSQLKVFGEAREVAELLTPTAEADDARAWRWACLACYLADAEGVARRPARGGVEYLVVA